MNGTSERKIEIFAPFNAALDLTKLILFQPFDLGKWFVIGFAAFLSHLAGGGGGGGPFNPRRHLPVGNWNVISTTNDAVQSTSGIPGWVIPLATLGAFVFVAVVVLLLWIGSRGKFIFTDCIVRNRGRIVEPWHEFRKEGNSYFLFTLLVGACALVILGLGGLPLWMPLALHRDLPHGPALVGGLILLALIALLVLVPIAIISSFMIPIMYRRRCGAGEAVAAAWSLIVAEPGPVILYLLFAFVLQIAFAMIACLTTCLTCCITAIPYLGTVVLLPAYVFFMSYLLLFVRQFGPDFDVWASAVTPATSAETMEVPPLEPPPEPPTPPVQT